MLVAVALGIVLVRVIVIPKVEERLERRTAYAAFGLVGMIGLLAAGFSGASIVFAGGIFLAAVFCTAAAAVTTTMISLASPAGDRGLALGANQAAMAGAYFVGSLFNGLLYQFGGDWTPYAAGAFALVLSGLLLPAMTSAAPLARKVSGEAA